MPRKSPYEIILTDVEQKKLEVSSRKYTSPYCEVIRARVILFCAMGLQNKEIGERLDLPRQIVSKWRKRFFHKRLAGLQDVPRNEKTSVQKG